MAASHNVTRWLCSECSFELDEDEGTFFATESAYRDHLLESHGGSFDPIDLPLVLNLGERTMIESVSCPLCLNDRNLVHVEHDQHIAIHLHSFSLRALPWDFDLDEGAASAGSSGSPPAPGPQPFLDDLDDDPAVDAETVQQEAKKLQSILKRTLDQPDGFENFKGLLPGVEASHATNLLALVEHWASSSVSTTSQKQTCAFVLARMGANLGSLVANGNLDSVQIADYGTSIAIDLQALEECIYQTARDDHNIWQESFQTLSAYTKKTVQGIIDNDDFNTESLPEQLENLLKLSWELEKASRKKGQTRQHDVINDIVGSVQLLADDESIFLAPNTKLPWVAVRSAMKV
jgi:hypothetical protein